MKTEVSRIFRFLVILFHLVGAAGFIIPSLNILFLKIVPFHLLLMMMLLIISGSGKGRSFWTFFITVLLSGFFIELAGVHTGLLFGRYAYGNTLGVKLWEVPLMIGINWFILVYAAGVSMNKLKMNATVKAALGAMLLLALDILIEPVAVKFGYWKWAGDGIPLQNYLCWFLFSFFLLCLFFAMNFKKQNPLALTMLICQFGFFIVQNLWLF